MKFFFLSTVTFAMTTFNCFASVPVVQLELSSGVEAALKNSHRVKSNERRAESSEALAHATNVQRYPQISIESSYQYNDHLSQLTLGPPINRSVLLGNQDNYSLGATARYLLTDFNQIKLKSESIRHEAKAQAEATALVQRETVLQVKSSFSTILYLESQLNSHADAWELAINQERDIKRRLEQGSSSKLDFTNASKETLSFKLKFLQIQRTLASALLDWNNVTGVAPDKINYLYPLTADLSKKNFLASYQTVLISLVQSPMTTIQGELKNHPTLKQLNFLKTAKEKFKEANFRSYFPQIALSARASLDYPDGNNNESFVQKSILLSLSFPIWDGGQRSALRLSDQRVIESLQEAISDTEEKLVTDKRKLELVLEQLSHEEVVTKEALMEVESLAKLTYQTYINGRVNYLQVQTANLKVLEWKLQLDGLQHQRNLALANLEFIGGL